MFRKLTIRGRLLNPLYCRNASAQWIRSPKYLFVRHHSSALALQEIPQPPDTSDWLFQIPPDSSLPSELEVPLPPTAVFLNNTIDWEVVDKILEKHPILAKAINLGQSRYRDAFFLASLWDISHLVQHKAPCTFEYESKYIKATNGHKNLVKCNLTCNLPGVPPLKTSATSTKTARATNAAILQLLLVLEEKQLLDVLLSFVTPKCILKDAKKGLKNINVQPTETAPVMTMASSGIISTLPAPLAAQQKLATEPTPVEKPQEEITHSSHVTREVFNYAARYLYVPRYTVTVQMGSKGKFSSNFTRSEKLRSPKRVFTVEISLPEHGIHATATGDSLGLVEAKACVNFKKQAEKYHIANAVPSDSFEGPIFLSTGNARNFMDFYNDHNAKIAIKVIREGGFWTGQASARESKTTARELIGQINKRNSVDGLETLTFLVAAVTIVKQRPELLLHYMENLDSRSGKYVGKAHPMELEVHQSSQHLMQRTVETTSKLGLSTPLTDEPVGYDVSLFPRPLETPFLYHGKKTQQRSHDLLKWYRGGMAGQRRVTLLPLKKHSSEVLSLVESNQYSIIVGKTGSGKTTQLPQIILDDYIRKGYGGTCRIICTQPRRIAATSVAQRVAEERGQELCDQVGYKIGYNAKLPKVRGSITYCTTGIVLQQLIHCPDDLLDNISHLIIDEVHERDINIDFLLTIVRKLIKERIESGKRAPKVCFMSATMDAEMFQEYFASTEATGGEVSCPILHVEGRAFPVERHYLENIMDNFKETYPEDHAIWGLLNSTMIQSYLKSEENDKKSNLPVGVEGEKVDSVIRWDSHGDDPDSLQNQMKMDLVEGQIPVDLAVVVIAHIADTTEDGAILLFLPGIRSINIVETVLRTQNILDVDFNNEDKFKIFKLHSSTSDENQEVFKPVPQGCRKIILATNVAETSITVDDIQYVVDTGKHKEDNFHQMLRIWSLPCKWVSKSSVKQRSGRAGRVKNGSYYALFSKHRYDSLRTVSRPGMRRVDLQSTCLAIKVLGYQEPIQDFLDGAPEPPSPQAIQSSVESLKTLGALTDTETITPLGRLLGMLPLRPALGKMIILGIIFRCLDSMIILGALDGILLQVRPLGMEEESDSAMRGFAKASKSDHIAMLNAFRALRNLEEVDGPEVMRSFAHQKFLSVSNYEKVKQAMGLIQQALQRNGLIQSSQTAVADGSGVKYGGALLNENSDQDGLIRALLVQGLYPHIGTWDNHKSRYQIVTNEKLHVSIHPSSINNPKQRPSLNIEGIKSSSKGNARLLSFSTLALISENNLVMHRTTAVTPFMASLFSGTLNQSDVNVDRLEVDKWLPFDVRSTEEQRGAEGAAARTIVQFNKALRQLEEAAFRDLAKGVYVVDNEMSHVLGNALRKLLLTEQDVERAAEEYEFDLGMSLHKFWTPPEALSKEIPLEQPLDEETPYDEDSHESFIELVKSALEAPITTRSHSNATLSSSQARSYFPTGKWKRSTKEKDRKESRYPADLYRQATTNHTYKYRPKN
ncbi:hypothetical protein EAF04_004308 [Stromatinia cepivora]|nr:hypothetical protein EAF04_004308 [Stromatinia cepivora]